MKFQVGDLIKGLPGNGYNITNYNMYKAKVLETFGNGEMNIKILSHKDKTKINEKYWVENSEEHFELINSFTKKDLKDGDIVTYRNGEKRFERKEEVLDETEKRYLTGVIRPFRDKVEYMKKHLSTSAKEFIEIYIKENISIVLPYFEKGTMYKGMKVNREYTLKELGL